jgi:hypothetical protein
MRRSLLAPLLVLFLTPTALAQPAAPGQRPATSAPTAAPTPAQAQVPGPEQFSGRGVYYFAGNVRCPLAGVGKRGDFHCNRLTIDDEHSQVSIDRRSRRILLVNTHSYGKKQIVGDFLFLGSGKTQDGTRAPVGIHLKIEKKGDEFTADAHAHPTLRDSIVAAEFEPFTVVIRNSRGDTQVLNPDQALTTIREPSIGLRLASKLLTAWDNLEGVKEDPTRPGYVLVDISFGFGIGGLSQKILRMQIVSVDGGNAPIIATGTLPEMLQRGVWELRLRALSNLGGEAFERDLFLIGLDGLELLKPLAKDGMEKDNMLTIRIRNGRGTVFFGDKGQPIGNAPDVARAYLEFNALGAVVAHQVGVRHSRR